MSSKGSSIDQGSRNPIVRDIQERPRSEKITKPAVLRIALPPSKPWDRAAYGADGVRKVFERLQTELAREMVPLSSATLRDIRGSHVRIDQR